MPAPVARRGVLLAVAAALLTCVACGGAPTAPQESSPLPPRPGAVDVDGRDPCGLLDAAALAEFDLGSPEGSAPLLDGVPVPSCTYLGRSTSIDSSVQFLPVPASELARNPGAVIGSTAGYGTVRTVDDDADVLPRCDVAVDIRDDVSLRVQTLAGLHTLAEAGQDVTDLCRRSEAIAVAATAGLLAG